MILKFGSVELGWLFEWSKLVDDRESSTNSAQAIWLHAKAEKGDRKYQKFLHLTFPEQEANQLLFHDQRFEACKTQRW
jgi:hypothetical protein